MTIDTSIEQYFNKLAEKVDFCSLRIVQQQREALSVRRDVVQPLHRGEDSGAMITVADKGGVGYAATPDLSPAGLQQSFAQAQQWAHATAKHNLLGDDFWQQQTGSEHGEFYTAVQQPWLELPLSAKLDLLQQQCSRLKIDPAIINWSASLRYNKTATTLLTSHGARLCHHSENLIPDLSVSANRDGETQNRSLSSELHVYQGGLEILDTIGFYTAAPELAEQTLQLLSAPNCPDETMDLILAPDQMILQIHESIGHPLELDRILGDERNYAGTSFVTPEMFGSYQYGSELLNVTFDPTIDTEIASYAFDDDGTPAQREYLIKEGLLLRPLGGALSQRRASLPGVANSRACNWNRPPMDRMANLNIEPGTGTLIDLIAQVERGVYMQTNQSWSIDDSRNKFQFGCEYAQMIKNGELTAVVKNPSYRGISSSFWRSLDGVGGAEAVAILGAANCGKGEPNQAISVGHASPPCLFRDVAVFGAG